MKMDFLPKQPKKKAGNMVAFAAWGSRHTPPPPRRDGNAIAHIPEAPNSTSGITASVPRNRSSQIASSAKFTTVPFGPTRGAFPWVSQQRERTPSDNAMILLHS